MNEINCLLNRIALMLFMVAVFMLSLSISVVVAAGPIIIDHDCTDLKAIPNSAIIQAKSTLHIAYGHTSHGSQLISGMGGSNGAGLDNFLTNNPNYDIPAGLYIWNEGGNGGALDLDDYAMGGDVGYYPQWVNNTQSYLGTPNPDTGRGTNHPGVNVIIWSWCGQASGRTEQGMIDTYLAPMSQLELDYFGITFVYMTGHLDGSGLIGNLHQRNQQIRNYCRANNKVLYDFADIESYDPTGLINYNVLQANDNCDYDSDGNDSRDRNWAREWQDSHVESEDWWPSGAAHSQHLNGNRKGYAAWWLWARIAGWNPATPVEPPPPSSKLYYPHIASGEGQWETEVCVLNTSDDQTVSGVFRTYNENGQALLAKVNVVLAPHGRRELTVGRDFTDPAAISYMIFESDGTTVIGYTKFYIDGRYRVAVPAVAEVNSDDVSISHIASDSNWWTGLSLVNTTSAGKNLTFSFDNGETRLVTLGAGEHHAFLIKSLFADNSQPDIHAAVISGMEGVVGLKLFGGSHCLSGVLLTDKITAKLYFPHVADDVQWWTGIVARNPHEVNCELVVSPYTGSGEPLIQQTLSLAPSDRYCDTPANLGLPATAAWFVITAENGITGFALFGSRDGMRLGGCSSVGLSGTQGVFAKIEKKGWTGIAFVNCTENTMEVLLTARDDDGNVIAAESVNLAAYEKMAATAATLFSTDITGATYIDYSSTGEIVGFQLNNSADNSMFDALPRLQ